MILQIDYTHFTNKITQRNLSLIGCIESATAESARFFCID